MGRMLDPGAYGYLDKLGRLDTVSVAEGADVIRDDVPPSIMTAMVSPLPSR